MTGAIASAIVLGGRREGKVDALAQTHGVSDKCLVPIAGRPLIEHVVSALADSDAIGQIVVSVNDPAMLDLLPVCGPLIASRRVTVLRSKGNLADSVIDAAAVAGQPALITTADHALLTAAVVSEIVRHAAGQRIDAAAVFARRSDILSAHPDGQRRFYRFADDFYSNCNFYWLGSPAAIAAAEAFRSGGQFAKNPLRIAGSFGLWNLIRFRLGLDDLDHAFARVSRRAGLSIRPLKTDHGWMAIDVDNERTYGVVETIMQARAA